MMSGVMRRTTALLITTMLASMAIAQEDPVEEQPPARRYAVELVVFSYAEDVAVGTEQFVAPESDEPFIADEELLTAEGEGRLPEDSVELIDEVLLQDPVSLEPEGSELEFVLLSDNDYTMTEIVEQLELLDAYQPLMHVAWIQPTYPREETPAIQLHAFGEIPAGLEGSFTLYLSRYLHLVVDLTLDASSADTNKMPTGADENQRIISYADSRQQADIPYSATDEVIRYRLQEHRIVKNGELRYFDHPKFGVIARVTRVEEEPEEVEEERYNESRELFGESISPGIVDTG